MIKKDTGKIQKFTKSTKTNTPKGHSAATNIPPIGDGFKYQGTSFDDKGNGVIVSFERTDFFQFRIISFYYYRYSVLTNNSMKSFDCFGNELLLADNTWSTR